jgi:hypothetical protein
VHSQSNERGSATAELVVALPFLITLTLIGVKFVGATLETERLRYLAEGIVQAVMRDESDLAIKRELTKALPGSSFTITEREAGRFSVTVRHSAASASADGFR